MRSAAFLTVVWVVLMNDNIPKVINPSAKPKRLMLGKDVFRYVKVFTLERLTVSGL